MNFDNRTLFIADNLDIMRGMDSDTIDLIYLDPPFNTKKQYKAPIGSPAEGATFKDIWTDEDVKDGWYSEIAEQYPHIHQIILAAEHTYDHAMMIYLMAMGIRLIEMKRILKPKGSIYLHCDPTASHYLKLVMDSIFGSQSFRNEIVWCYRGGGVPKHDFSRKHDIILRYSKTKSVVFNVNDVRIPYSESVMQSSESRYDKSYRGDKVYSGYKPNELGKHPEDWWPIQPLMPSDKKERTGYPTQKPLILLDRIIKASSNKGDMVLDPFCGCATACVAAERLGRQWIGIDISPSAETITKYRLLEEVQPLQPEIWHDVDANVIVTNNPPIRTDVTDPKPQQPRLPNYRVHKNDLYGIQEGYCNGCRRHFEIRNLTVDHIRPQVDGGTDHIKNLQLLCAACNSTKGTGTQEELISRLKEQDVLR